MRDLVALMLAPADLRVRRLGILEERHLVEQDGRGLGEVLRRPLEQVVEALFAGKDLESHDQGPFVRHSEPRDPGIG